MYTLGDRIIAYMKAKQYTIRAINLVALEGSDAEGRPIKDTIDHWNDRILVIKNDGTIVVNTDGTTEPGLHYTNVPMNKRGAARIALGFQDDIWTFGKHFKQNALVQCAPIKVHRDLNKDGFRTGDIVTVENGMGLNFHTTANEATDISPATIGRWSAGCVVVRSSKVFYKEIMPLLRYSGRKTFGICVIDPKELPKIAS